jgi:hypothetical protein
VLIATAAPDRQLLQERFATSWAQIRECTKASNDVEAKMATRKRKARSRSHPIRFDESASTGDWRMTFEAWFIVARWLFHSVRFYDRPKNKRMPKKRLSAFACLEATLPVEVVFILVLSKHYATTFARDCNCNFPLWGHLSSYSARILFKYLPKEWSVVKIAKRPGFCVTEPRGKAHWSIL